MLMLLWSVLMFYIVLSFVMAIMSLVLKIGFRLSPFILLYYLFRPRRYRRYYY
jgi:hypothetical protein